MFFNSAGYDLSEVELDQWVFSVRGGKVFTGTFVMIVVLMVTRYGFNIDDLEAATKEMVKNSHNTAHFGMYKSIIHTFNREEQRKTG